jgi:sterol 3beta-glucosyltransferase
MRIVITTFGSTGDVQPLLGLADELRRSGHEPVWAAPAVYEERLRHLGFPFFPIGTSADPDLWAKIFATQMEQIGPVEQTRHFLDAILPIMPQMFAELRTICRDADVLISPSFQLAARMVHEVDGLPFVSVHFSPFGSTSSKAVREVSAPLVNRYRQQKGLPPLGDPLGADGASPQLALYAVSRHVFRPPQQWPAHYHLTGYFYFDEEAWQPDPELVAFVESGEPPVVITFGSMPNPDPQALTDAILGAIDRVGCRAVIQHGKAGLAQGRVLPKNIYATGFIPHRWLFPRSACIAHHGGAGTTAATFRAGVPMVVVPHFLDQPIWGEYARALGCAGAVIPRNQLSAERLGAAIQRTLSNPRHRQAAASMSVKVNAENGVRAACQLIEKAFLVS